MKISLISAEYSPRQGGVGDYTRELALALAKQGHKVQVITTGLRQPDSGEEKSREISTRAPETPPEQTDPASEVEVIRPVHRWDWRIIPIISGIIAREQPDLVNIQYQTGAYGMHPAINLLSWWLSRRQTSQTTGPIVITTFHDLRVPYLWPKAGRLREVANWLFLRYCPGVIVTNSRDYREIARRGYSGKARLIPIGSNIAVGTPAGYTREGWREEYNISKGTLLLAYFGFLNASKGCETVLQALAKLREENLECRLVLIGGQTGTSDPTNQGYAAEIEHKIRELGLERLLLRPGYISPLAVSGWLQAADLAVLPFRDGAGFRRGSLLAPLAHALPVVSTFPPFGEDTSEFGDKGMTAHEAAAAFKLVDGLNITLVPPDDAGELARAIKKLGADPKQRQAQGVAGRLLVTRCEWSEIASAECTFVRDLHEKRMQVTSNAGK